MKHKTIIAAALAIAILPAASFAGVKAEFDRKADFSNYQTYSWSSDEQTTASDQPAIDHIRADIEQELAEAGLEKVECGGDLELDMQAQMTEEIRTTITDYGPRFVHPRRAYRWGWPYHGTTVIGTRPVSTGSLEVTLTNIDGERVWTGKAEGIVRDSAEKNLKKADKAVDKMFKKLPIGDDS